MLKAGRDDASQRARSVHVKPIQSPQFLPEVLPEFRSHASTGIAPSAPPLGATVAVIGVSSKGMNRVFWSKNGKNGVVARKQTATRARPAQGTNDAVADA